MRTICVGGARLNPEPARRVVDTMGAVLMQVFGMAEGLLCYTRRDDPDDVVVHTQGRPVSPDDETRIVDDDGGPVDDGEVGELQCRGPYTIRGYYRADEHNATAFTADGFYRTGDMVRRHPSGNFVVEGRKKDLMNRGGEKISAEEIENLILAHPTVLNAAVVAMNRYLLDERRIAKFKLPERLEVRDRFPTTAVGKVSKQQLRDELRVLLEQGRQT